MTVPCPERDVRQSATNETRSLTVLYGILFKGCFYPHGIP